MRRDIWLDGLAAGAVFAVLLGSLVPGGIRLLPFDLPDQKHLLAYGLMALLITAARGSNLRRAVGIAAALASLGLLIELLQILIPGRISYGKTSSPTRWAHWLALAWHT